MTSAEPGSELETTTVRQRISGTPAPNITWTPSDGMTIAGDIWGPLHATPVLLLHGGGQTRHAWKNTAQFLASIGYRAAALDFRGHGDSSWSADGDYSIESMTRDLKFVIDKIGPAKPVLVGASLGGVVSLSAVGEGLIDAAALVLVDVAPRLERAGVTKIAAFMDDRPDGFESLQAVADAIAAYQPQRTRPRNIRGLAKNVRVGNNKRYYWHWDPQFRLTHNDSEARRVYLEQCARQIKVPTLLVRGGISDVLSEQGAQEFLTLCPHAQYVDVAGAAHTVAGDRNDSFTHVVADFLARTVAPAAFET